MNPFVFNERLTAKLNEIKSQTLTPEQKKQAVHEAIALMKEIQQQLRPCQ